MSSKIGGGGSSSVSFGNGFRSRRKFESITRLTFSNSACVSPVNKSGCVGSDPMFPAFCHSVSVVIWFAEGVVAGSSACRLGSPPSLGGENEMRSGCTTSPTSRPTSAISFPASAGNCRLVEVLHCIVLGVVVL